MRGLLKTALLITIGLLTSAGCRQKLGPQKLIYNIPGPEVPTYGPKWELYEHHFPMELSPNEAIPLLQRLGYRFLTPEEEVMADAFVWQQSSIANISVGMIYLDHPIIVFFQPENTDKIYIKGFDEGLFPRQIRDFYEKATLGEEYGWLVLREKPFRE